MTLESINWGISNKQDGSMKDEPGNRLVFLKKNHLDKKIIISADLIHGKRVVSTDNFKNSQTMINCDALITNNLEQVLTLTVADCLPVYFYDPQKKVIALAHAGWRGLVADILPVVINFFQEKYQSQAQDILVFIGPHLRACHFAVQADVADLFSPTDQITKLDKTFVNLAQVAKKQLLSSGLANNNITISSDCTYCLEDKYFSYRRDREQGLKTMLAHISFSL